MPESWGGCARSDRQLGSAKHSAGMGTMLGCGLDGANIGRAVHSGPAGRRLDSELGYFKLMVAHQKDHLPAQLWSPLGSCEVGRGEVGFCSFLRTSVTSSERV